MSNNRLSYTMSFKLKVVQYAEKPGKGPAYLNLNLFKFHKS
jgi:hypothetical protein